MNIPDEKYVYHGSVHLFELSEPKRNIRTQEEESGEITTIFDDISFHATPYKWIALTYTNRKDLFEEIKGEKVYYMKSVSLYKHKEEITIFGFNSLQESLRKMYGEGGYLYIFDKDNFFFVKGIGTLEVITKDKVTPIKIERIDDPVDEMRKLGVKIKFIDLALEENKIHRH